MMPTICLNMIVKNEAGIIRRCLESVKSIIDHWIILDTGSMDSTQYLIPDVLGNIPGSLIQGHWQDDFALARNQALTFAREVGDYILVMDADDELILGPGFDKNTLTEDAYGICDIHLGSSNVRTHLFKPSSMVHWEGVRHEYLVGLPPPHVLNPKDIHVKVNHDSARAKDPKRFLRDAQALQVALRMLPDKHSTIAWHHFQIAQSYWDHGDLFGAMSWYRSYLDQDHPEHTEHMQWMAKLRIAIGSEISNQGYPEIVRAYDDCISLDTERIEPYILLARFMARNNDYHGALDIMREAMNLNFIPKVGCQQISYWNERESFYNHLKSQVEMTR